MGVVYVALELEDNAFAKTAEINDEAVNHMLSAELETKHASVAEEVPGVALSWRCLFSELARERE